jgi:hypothetical protein
MGIVMGAFSLLACLAIGRNSWELRRALFLGAAVLLAAVGVIYFVSGYPLLTMGCIGAIYLEIRFYRETLRKGIKYREIAPGVGFIRADVAAEGEIPTWVRRKIDRRAGYIFASGLMSLALAAVAFIGDAALVGTTFTIGGAACLGRGAFLLKHGNLLPKTRDRLRASTRDPSKLQTMPPNSEQLDSAPNGT